MLLQSYEDSKKEMLMKLHSQRILDYIPQQNASLVAPAVTGILC